MVNKVLHEPFEELPEVKKNTVEILNKMDLPVPPDLATEVAQIEELEAEAKRIIDVQAEDPAAQSYFMRLDTHSVVKTEQEYFGCVKHHVQMKIVTYAHAQHLIAEEDARKRAKIKSRRAEKSRRASRKRNRR